MKHPMLFILAGLTAIVTAGTVRLSAQDGSIRRMSPFPAQRPRVESAPAWTPGHAQPAAGTPAVGRTPATLNGRWLGDRAENGRPPTLDELRAHLESRGIDPAAIDQRMARIRAARARGLRTGQSTPEEEIADSARMPQERAALGADLDAGRQARFERRDELPGDPGRFGRQVQGAAAREQAQLQARLVRQGVPPGDLNARLGKIYGSPSSDRAADARSVGGGVGRVRSRR